MKNILLTVFTIIILTSVPSSFADSQRNEKLEFAGTLEETLGHFWALELNLDENNSKLALVHATHPISELYETMSKHLENNPDFNKKLETTLVELKDKANTEVSKSEAKIAIDEAKTVIQEARSIVVGEQSNEDEFKIQLINTLLETAKVEYREAIEDGIIVEVAEFQDGSAFVWQSQQIFSSIENKIEPTDADRINEYFELVWAGFKTQESPKMVENYVDAVIYEFEELSGIQSEPSEHEEEVFGIESEHEEEHEEEFSDIAPLKQLREGINPKDIQCKSTHGLVFKQSGDPACVKTSSIQKLISMGWTR
jgi:hypothetical protein